MIKSHWMVSSVLVGGICLGLGAKAAEPLQLLTSGSHTRIVIPVAPEVPIHWKNSKQGFEISLQGITLNDLGASVGGGRDLEEQGSWSFRSSCGYNEYPRGGRGSQSYRPVEISDRQIDTGLSRDGVF